MCLVPGCAARATMVSRPPSYPPKQAAPSCCDSAVTLVYGAILRAGAAEDRHHSTARIPTGGASGLTDSRHVFALQS